MDVVFDIKATLFIAAIVVVVRRRVHKITIDPLLDGIVGGVAAAMLNWELVIWYLQNYAATAQQQFVTLIYSGMSFLAFMAAIFALVAGSKPTTSNRLLAAALIVTFSMDVAGNLTTSGVLEPTVLTYLGALVLALRAPA
ncbi:MAG: hypothetical protein R2789_04670 [Microthrixaceae bacterium]